MKRIARASWILLASGLAAWPSTAVHAQSTTTAPCPPPRPVPPPRPCPPPSVVFRSGAGLTRPLPLNFGGTKVRLPGPIGSYSPPPGSNFYPRPGYGYPVARPLPGGGVVGGAVIRGDRDGVGIHLGGAGRVPDSAWTHADRGAVDPGWHGYIGTSGAAVGYKATGDGLSFAAHLGNPWLSYGRHSLWRQWGTCYPATSWCYYPTTGWGWNYWDNWGGSAGYPVYSPIWPYPDPMLSQYYSPPAPTAQPEPSTGEAPLTLIEQAEVLLSYERFDEAAAAYREHLSQQSDDAESMRMLAVTLLLDRRPREAADVMLAAYRMNPALADSPVVLPPRLGPADLAAAANRAIEHAQRTRTAPSWLAAAVLSQARDKLPVARNFAKSAKAAGLDPEVYARLMSSWSS